MINPIREIYFKDLLDHATDLIQVITPEGIIVYANPSWQAALGLTPEEIVGHPIYSFIAEEAREKFNFFRNAFLDGNQSSVPVETRMVSKNGKEIIVEGYMSCTSENGRVLYTHSILRDVTKRRKEEKKMQEMYQQLLEREEDFYHLITYAPDAIIVIDAESKITLWNPKSEALFGWKAEEVTGTLLGNTIIPEKYRAMHYNGMKRFLSTGEIHVLNKTIEITALTKSGKEFNIALTISRSMQKGNIQFIAFIRDISEQKKMEEDLRLQQQQLENRNEELAQYASMASHDLKEPVRKILIFSDLLLKEHIGEPNTHQTEILNKIQFTARKMKALVEGITKFSSIVNADIELASVDLREVIGEVIADLEKSIKIKQATFIISTLPSVRMNRLHVYQLFENLITNSLKYGKLNHPPIVEISGKMTENGFITIDVSDNGIGFDNQYAQKVFQPFQRLHGTSYEGTGIGLSICKKIVEAYEGSIYVNSIKDKGSTFTFSLPVN